MCNFCGATKEEQAAISQGLYFRAEQLERFAVRLKMMSSGHIKPHTKEMETLTTQAHALIRFLVEDFM